MKLFYDKLVISNLTSIYIFMIEVFLLFKLINMKILANLTIFMLGATDTE